ncbi:hypothetical protein JO972_12915 [Verrucomicrobiaceae bacterium 5K15]|uniref:Uncharacterized protein n=1 Tax=Oceaniferula flava TaxID=2800421 RepID=A0AAE2SFY5_9BACT|nr:hypothetical protein [Oceaniferula flavus]MBK1855865.1 hypothetical protein [Oceaniferula flavus]MBM1137172.1 hypothetical protein [Oceaniferula flavus]
MSFESITPIPNASDDAPAPSASQPDPAKQLQEWISHEDAVLPFAEKPELPSLPAEPQPSAKASSSKPAELPELASLASQKVFSMDGLDELLASVYPDKAENITREKRPEQAKAAATIKESLGTSPIPKQAPSAEGKTRPTRTKLPSMELPSAETSAKGQTPPPRQKSKLAAMPSSSTPNVSIPLVRDQLFPPVDATPESPQASSPEPAENILSMPTPEAASDKQPRPQATAPVPQIPTEEEQAPPISQAEQPSNRIEEITATQRTDPENNPSAPPIPAAEPVAQPEKPAAQGTVSDRPAYTDADLTEALRPIIDHSVDKFLYTPSHGIHTYLEPMLRSTVRRAIAEQMEDSSPFENVAGWDKLAWKMRALFSSRSYEDIIFDQTKRYQVEEVFLLRRHTRSMVSYASNDPARHSHAGKVQSTVKKIASKCSGSQAPGDGESCIKWEENRHLMIRRGQHCILTAIVHGSSNAILRSDLDYALRQAEERFGKALEEENDIHLQILQPLLEGCLLIKAPAIPN